MTTTTRQIAPVTAKAILKRANLDYWFVGINEYHRTGFMFLNNAFHWVEAYKGDNKQQLGVTLQLISYLNKAGIVYEIGKSQGRWYMSPQAIILIKEGN
jgi:hypothetical protein